VLKGLEIQGFRGAEKRLTKMSRCLEVPGLKGFLIGATGLPGSSRA